MALTARKKKALGFGVTGLVFLALAVVLWTTTSTPAVVNVILAGIGAIANLVGLAVALPGDVT